MIITPLYPKKKKKAEDLLLADWQKNIDQLVEKCGVLENPSYLYGQKNQCYQNGSSSKIS